VPEIDALVVGAGPAGLATAIGLARRGARALVVEQRMPPLDKACGEGIMPAGVRMLAALGVDRERLCAAPLRGIRFFDGERELAGSFATGDGLGVRRTRLSEALLEVAARAGVEMRLGCRLMSWEMEAGGVRVDSSQGELRARVLVGADGMGSRIRARAGLALPPVRVRRFGIRRHYRVSAWSDFVEVHWGDGVEAYVTPVARDEVGIAFLFRGAGGDHEALLEGFPRLARRLAGAMPIDAVRGAGPFWQGARARTAPGLALVGDAAGYTDAVTGEGITLALRCADALAEVIASGAPLARYEADWWRLSRVHRRFASLLGFGVAHPVLRRAAFSAIAVVPASFEALLRIAAEETRRESTWVSSHPSA
jgi:flavin-dependent dehydrogenase